jgi:hypothetical protein
MIKTIRTWCLLCLSFLSLQAWAEMAGMDDESLDGVMAQASLFAVDYIPPGGGNPNANIGFYRLSLDAEMELNANIKNLSLGCGGVKGAGVCDLNIDNVRLTGSTATSASDSGPGTSAILTRPYFEFAIRNPGTAATREIVGIRFGSEQTLGKMTMGENPDVNNPNDDTGINSFSGDMNAVILNASMTDICARVIFCLAATATLDPYDYAALHGGNPLIFNRSQVTGCGSTDYPGNVNCMFFDGLVAHASLFGLTLDSRLTEDLRFVHDLAITDSFGNAVRGFNLSVQKEALRWQKVDGLTNPWATVAAQQGWWMSIPQVTIENLVITQTIEVDGLGALFGQPAVLQNVDLGQRPADNCYGALQFC